MQEKHFKVTGEKTPGIKGLNEERSDEIIYLDAMFLLSGAPTITEEPVDTVVDAGSTAVLYCQAEGEPTPTLEWTQQGRPLVGKDRFSSLPKGSLRISSVQKEDTAHYECVARNLMGSVLVRVALTVRGRLYTMA